MSTASLIYHLVHHSLRWPDWLERAQQRQALQQAIARVYPSFARQYPDWVDYFFDEYFLRQRAFPVLAGYLEFKALPTSFELARGWAEQFAWPNLEMKERHLALLMPVAADFLRRLDRELFH
ncbi:MAG: hypothetical protein HS126_34485 [Anaerolineales bacterium]|nr:hypothetical protein [Anaerolineales bacterium]